MKYIKERHSQGDFSDIFSTKWLGIHLIPEELESTENSHFETLRGPQTNDSYKNIWDFLRQNCVFIFCSVLAFYYPVAYQFSRDAMFIFIYTVTIGNWMIEFLPFEIICLPSILIGLHADGFAMENMAKTIICLSESKEITCLSAAMISSAVVKTNLHRRAAWFFISISDTRPQKVLLGAVTLVAITNLLMAPILTISLLHPLFSAVLEALNNCRKIRMSQEGSSKRDLERWDYEFEKFSTAVRLALPFTVNLTTAVILYKNDERRTYVNLEAWVAMLIPTMMIQCILLWTILVVRYFGFKKLWNWSSSIENMYAVFQLRTELKGRPNLGFAEFVIILGILFLVLLGASRTLKVLLPYLDDCQNLPKIGIICTLNLERATLIFACILLICPIQKPNFFILGNYNSKEPRGKWKPIINWNDHSTSMPWDVLLYLWCSDVFFVEIKKSKLLNDLRYYMLSNMGPDMIQVVAMLTFKVMTLSTFFDTPVVLYFFGLGIDALSSELRVAHFLQLVIIEVSSNFAFMFPISNVTNLMAYSAGGIVKSEMIICGFFVWVMSYVTFIASFSYIIPLYRLQMYRHIDGLKILDIYYANDFLCD